eukprot:jgi/Ulvmu1/12466/UM009_0118.1
MMLASSQPRHLSDLQISEQKFLDITGVPEDHVCAIGSSARYTLPTIGSMLPSYSNHQTDCITNAFSRVGFHSIHDIPANITPQSVMERRLANQEAAKTFMPGKQIACNSVRKQCTLFSTFEYIPSEYDSAKQQANVDRARSRAAQSQIAGTAFVPTAASQTTQAPWLDGFVNGACYPYLSTPYEAANVQRMQDSYTARLAEISSNPFVPAASGAHLTGCLTKAAKHSMQQALLQIIQQDWPGTQVGLYDTERQFWIVVVGLASVERPAGLAAYMSMLLQANSVVRAFRLSKVVEHWDITPGNGNAYYALRPPWVPQPITDAFYTLHPEQRSYQMLVAGHSRPGYTSGSCKAETECNQAKVDCE